jgi:uncharacterized membrane-anchored protein YitT (DUF2179 family)
MSEQWMELYCKACNKNALSQVIRVLEEGQQNVKVVLLQFLTTDLFSVLLCALNLPLLLLICKKLLTPHYFYQYTDLPISMQILWAGLYVAQRRTQLTPN